MKSTEMVAPVHQNCKSSKATKQKRPESTEDTAYSNRTFIKEDISNDNSILETPSRDVSVDGDSQINSKIIGLIESEIKREAKQSTFSDSRPQSLSFYEEEKVPEELSGNLELLSPEERKYFKRRKEKDANMMSQTDTDDRHTYNVQDIYDRPDTEEIPSNALKKSKNRKTKKRVDSEMGMGDSREMMIPKEKRKTKKKKHEASPSASMSSSKQRKHRKRDDEYDYSRNDVTLALEDLQDDVFEHSRNVEEYPKNDKIKRSPRKSEKLYVQKKNKFEMAGRDLGSLESHPIRQQLSKPTSSPLFSAIKFQKCWRMATNFCHGLLGGLGFAHMTYIVTNKFAISPESLKNYALYSEMYVILFYVLCVLCLVSVLDKYDVANFEGGALKGFARNRRGTFVIVLYIIAFVLHLVTAPNDSLVALVAQDFEMAKNISSSEMTIWSSLSVSRGFFAFLAWFFTSLSTPEDFLYSHLKSLDPFMALED